MDKEESEIDYEDEEDEEDFPEIFRFKWICSECKTIDDVIETLKGITAYFEELKEKGYKIGGGIEDDYMELISPE